MTKSMLEFDEIAADDALIEAIRAGATADDLPAHDPASPLLLALRDGADAPAGAVATAKPSRLGAVVRHRRSIASVTAACALAIAGVGTAVAGDPTAAFRYVFQQGVDLGSRFGTPADEHAQKPFGGGGVPIGTGTTPVRRGSAAAPVVEHDPTREPFGFEQHTEDWSSPLPDDGLSPFADDDRSTSDTDQGQEMPRDGVPPTIGPHHERPETPDPETPTPETHTYGPQNEDTDDRSEAPPEAGPGEIEPRPQSLTPSPEETSPAEPSPSPSESSPAEPSPTPSETSPTPSEPPSSEPTSPTPSESSEPTSPEPSEPSEPTSSAPTSPSPSPSESSATP